MSSFEFKATRRVEFADTDMEGIMHFSNFFRFMETAEHAFLRSLGYSAVLARNGLEVCLPRVHAECDYLAPLRFEDEVLVHLLVERKGGRSLTYRFRFYKVDGASSEEVARGLLTVACAARQKDGSLKAAPLPAALANQLQEAPPALLADGRLRSQTRKTHDQAHPTMSLAESPKHHAPTANHGSMPKPPPNSRFHTNSTKSVFVS